MIRWMEHLSYEERLRELEECLGYLNEDQQLLALYCGLACASQATILYYQRIVVKTGTQTTSESAMIETDVQTTSKNMIAETKYPNASSRPHDHLKSTILEEKCVTSSSLGPSSHAATSGEHHLGKGQAVVERTHLDLKRVLSQQQQVLKTESPSIRLAKALFTMNFLNCSFEMLNPPIIQHFGKSKQLVLKAKSPVLIKDPETGQTEGPHRLVTWGRGYSCIPTPTGLRWIPAKWPQITSCPDIGIPTAVKILQLLLLASFQTLASGRATLLPKVSLSPVTENIHQNISNVISKAEKDLEDWLNDLLLDWGFPGWDGFLIKAGLLMLFVIVALLIAFCFKCMVRKMIRK
ncbi:hypothetical protein HGM15179_019560 [Zosterops borbonicus]|uniref:Integrase-type domain-containing protein n=1 Tax=Zosterops borbonicus TaxID=364589 RepID=A0A8K1D8J2_9PASS|nr:hypothetical protein HGM15179_019560 [Zosterops borbonicus]